MTRREQFQTECHAASLKCGIRFVLYYDDGPSVKDDVYRDGDGLHIRKDGYRARFDIAHNINDRGVWPGTSSPTLSASKQNDKVRALLEALKMSDWLTIRGLVEPAPAALD